jgi:hypothetical protein
MAKWIWKLYAGEQGLWEDILRAKYLQFKDLLVDKHHLGSQFWNSVHKIMMCLAVEQKIHTVLGRLVEWPEPL